MHYDRLQNYLFKSIYAAALTYGRRVHLWPPRSPMTAALTYGRGPHIRSAAHRTHKRRSKTLIPLITPIS